MTLIISNTMYFYYFQRVKVSAPINEDTEKERVIRVIENEDPSFVVGPGARLHSNNNYMSKPSDFQGD